MWTANKPGQDSECGSVNGSEACGSSGREKESEKGGLARSCQLLPPTAGGLPTFTFQKGRQEYPGQ